MSFNERIISIDFGNSYCKVGLRPGKNESSALLSDPSFNVDEGHFCIPTIIGKPAKGRQCVYGTDVFAEGPGVKVYRNWKPLFFEADQGSGRASVRQSLEADGFDIEELALGFFNWLRKQVIPICRHKYGITNADKIPVRITLPAFGNVAAATERLESLLEESGWTLSHKASAVQEPLANAIGAFSRGRNAVWYPPPPGFGPKEGKPGGTMFLHYGRMFDGSPFLHGLQSHALGEWEDHIHWVLVVDLGGYTLDFAMLGFHSDRPEDMESTLQPRPTQERDQPPRFARLSYPLGVTDLDQMVYDVIPGEQQNAFEHMMGDPDQGRLETFHRVIYRTFGQFRVERVTIGGGRERDNIRDAVHRFAKRIQDLAGKFMDTHQFSHVHHLVLTGGGSNIPAVRQALMDQLVPGCTHAARVEGDGVSFPSDACFALSHNEVRGATATGGTSVYFEFLEG